MIMNDDGRAHIFHQDALNPRELAPEPVKAKRFNLVLTNPFFGKRISAPTAILDYFQITRDERGRVKKNGSFLTEVLFVERNLTRASLLPILSTGGSPGKMPWEISKT
jgi:hypothetical protein